MLRRLAAVLVVAGVTAGAALAAGPSPGIDNGGKGVASPGGKIRYVTIAGTRSTVVRKIGAKGVLAKTTIAGLYGIPRVTWSGQTDGLSRDGRSLVLSTLPGRTETTRLLVLDARTLTVRTRVTLPGVWSFDALSPDGRTVYLIEYLEDEGYVRYRVRAYDLAAGRLVKQVVVDKSEPGPMTGEPLSRATSADGAWAYTLYQRGNGTKPFIHALDTRDRFAVCIDLNWRGTNSQLVNMRLTLSPDQKRLILRHAVDGKVVLTVTAPR